MSDMHGRCDVASWDYGVSIGGESLRYFVVTDGVRGAKVYTQDDVQHVPAVPAEVVDTTGAGDAYAAGLIHGLCAGKSITQAMSEGAVWAAFAVATDSSIPGEALKQYLEA